jgi:hypothetical protein
MPASFYAQNIIDIEAVAQRGLGNPVVLTVTDRNSEQVMIYLFVDTPERASEIEALFMAVYGPREPPENTEE